MKEYFVYIIRCSDEHYYTGITNNVERRVQEHNDGIDPKCYTHKRRPVSLIYHADFREVLDAIAWETKVKKWSRKKKEMLIRGEYEKLPLMSQCKNGTHYTFYLPIACHAERSRSATRDLLSHGSTTLTMTQK